MGKENNLIKVGQKIYAIGHGNSLKNLIEVEVIKVGSKYFETDNKLLGRFDKKTLVHDAGGYAPRFVIYLSKETYYEEKEKIQKISEIRTLFGSYGNVNINLDIVRKIHNMLFNKLN